MSTSIKKNRCFSQRASSEVPPLAEVSLPFSLSLSLSLSLCYTRALHERLPVVNCKLYKPYARGMGGTATIACLLLDLVEVNYGKAVKSTREKEIEREGAPRGGSTTV